MTSRNRPVPAAHLSFIAKSRTAPAGPTRTTLVSWPPTSTRMPGSPVREKAPRAWQVISVCVLAELIRFRPYPVAPTGVPGGALRDRARGPPALEAGSAGSSKEARSGPAGRRGPPESGAAGVDSMPQGAHATPPRSGEAVAGLLPGPGSGSRGPHPEQRPDADWRRAASGVDLPMEYGWHDRSLWRIAPVAPNSAQALHEGQPYGSRG
jgi:hypothetical protein